jgi:hypothetical protein
MTKMTTAPTSEIVIYQTEDGLTKLDVMLKEETTWLNLNQITSLFERESLLFPSISEMFIRKGN